METLAETGNPSEKAVPVARQVAGGQDRQFLLMEQADVGKITPILGVIWEISAEIALGLIFEIWRKA